MTREDERNLRERLHALERFVASEFPEFAETYRRIRREQNRESARRFDELLDNAEKRFGK